jgi:2-oxoglutarate dehydrogenase E2 component (dihydrolipoamide succinyltransferase)
MIIEIKVPSPGESITQVQLASWLVQDGDYVEKDDEIAEIDSDKATLSITAEESGRIKILVSEGESLEVGSVIGSIDTQAARGDSRVQQTPAATLGQPPAEISSEPAVKAEPEPIVTTISEYSAVSSPGPFVTPQPPAQKTTEKTRPEKGIKISPLARKEMEDKSITQQEIMSHYGSLRVSRKDVQTLASDKMQAGSPAPPSISGGREVERKKMSTLRLKLSERLVAAKNETAMLTTFNEIDMKAVMDIRKQYKETFQERYGVSLGLMSFFTKAVIEALSQYPIVNASIDQGDIVYHKYVDIGIAVSTPKGLAVPVIRNTEGLGFAEIELRIKELADKARNNKITLDEMSGGTFTITNGGVFGSMLSTPILNPPQSAILGMHNIVDRPVAISGKVEIHPVMYVALSYDHRLIDGRESVGFLYHVKEMLENPIELLFGGNDPIRVLLKI